MDDLGFDFYQTKPPIRTVIRARYTVNEPWMIVETCRHGCCVHSALGSMTLPTWWKPAEAGDAERLADDTKRLGEAMNYAKKESRRL